MNMCGCAPGSFEREVKGMNNCCRKPQTKEEWEEAYHKMRYNRDKLQGENVELKKVIKDQHEQILGLRQNIKDISSATIED